MGLDKIDVEYLKEKGIALQIARNANTNSVADHHRAYALFVTILQEVMPISARMWKKPVARICIKAPSVSLAGCHWKRLHED